MNEILEVIAVDREDISVDQLINDINTILETSPLDTQLPEEAPKEESTTVQTSVVVAEPPKEANPRFIKALKGIGAAALVLLETVLLLVVALYGVMYILAKGPSPTARDLFVRSVKETSAGGFLAHLYFSDEEIAQIIGSGDVPEYVETDTSLIEIPKPTENTSPDGPVPDAWGLVDEDGDGIILEEVKGEGYSGYMMVVLDPSRVIMGSVPENYGARGYSVAKMVERFGAVAGINAGGFYDPEGGGNGSIPDNMVVYDGKIYYAEKGNRFGFCGFDDKYIMHVGNLSTADIRNKNIRYGVSFGPVLIANGEECVPKSLGGGVNPRTAIGQRSDGAVLLLVIDGRQVSSLGATFMDLAEVFLSYGAVNAYNLDGGSSSMMWYQGDYVNNCASMIGIRPVPTSFLVMPEGGN